MAPLIAQISTRSGFDGYRRVLEVYDVSIIGSKSLSSSKGRPSSRRGGYVINKVLDNVVVEGIDKEASSSDPISSIAGFDFGNPESDEDEVLDPGDEMASYMSSSGGGFQLEDDFYDGYEAQVYAFPRPR
ncbi:hypothetical protein Tco_1199078 [Tanacetum coccineum]